MNLRDRVTDITVLSRVLKTMLYAGAGLALVSAVSSYMQLELLGGAFTDAEAESNDARERLLGHAFLVLRVATIVVFSRWVFRAHQSVRYLGASGMRITPGWAVGVHFIPLANLWMPYQAMQDLSAASRNPECWDESGASPLLPLWWGLWITTGVLGRISARYWREAEELADFKLVTQLELAGTALDVILCLVAAQIISTVWRDQFNHRARSVSP